MIQLAVSLDDGKTWTDVPNGVRLVYNNVELLDDNIGQLHLTCTHEGVVTDVWGGDVANENLGTFSETVDEIIGRLTD